MNFARNKPCTEDTFVPTLGKEINISIRVENTYDVAYCYIKGKRERERERTRDRERKNGILLECS